MDHFKTFMEDYNTATMPHEKFYHYERWEVMEYQEKQRREQEKVNKSMGDDGWVMDDSHGQGMFSTLNDEEELRRKRKQEKEQKERQEFQLIHNIMKSNKSLQQDMKRQSELQLELQQAHRRGDTATVKRLERLLAPDEK
jgi:hypothetical protein